MVHPKIWSFCSALLADIGGSLGLVLGLRTISVFNFYQLKSLIKKKQMKKTEKSYWCYISQPTFIQKSEDDLKNSSAASVSRKYDNRDKFLSLFC